MGLRREEADECGFFYVAHAFDTLDRRSPLQSNDP